MATATKPPQSKDPSPIDHLEATGVELFRAGSQTDSSGQQKQWTVADLDEMAIAYNDSVGTHDAPILVGHDGNTAYGWLKRIYRDGNTLKGDYSQVEDGFAEAVNQGRYKKRSISIYPRDYAHNPTPGRLNIRHLAYVGVPAVKGLADHKFADGDDGGLVYEFGDDEDYSGFQIVAKIFQAMRDRLIETSGVDAAEQQMPAAMLGKLMAMDKEMPEMGGEVADYSELEQTVRAIATNAFKEELEKTQRPSGDLHRFSTKSGESMTTEQTADVAAQTVDLSADFAEMRSQLDSLTAKNAALVAENEAQAKRLGEIENARERDRVTNFMEDLARKLIIRPADVANKVELAMQMPNEVAFEYSEGGEKKNGTLRDRYLADLAAATPIVSTAPMRTGPGDAPHQFAEASRAVGAAEFSEESLDADAKIRAYMAQKSCSYADAVTALTGAGQI